MFYTSIRVGIVCVHLKEKKKKLQKKEKSEAECWQV